MNQQAFIFSNEPRYRIRRHLLFWSSWFLFCSFLYAFVPVRAQLGYFQRIPNSIVDSFMFLPIHISLSYGLMYFVIPRYVVRNRYSIAALWTLVLVLGIACMSAIISMYLLNPVKVFVLPSRWYFSPDPVKHQQSGLFYLSLLAGLRGGITIGGLAAAIKLMKHWYTEGQRNLKLQKENAESQLQILKAQVHPHFLFNTLNNIYSFTQNTSASASQMLMGLSDILRYMLYECNQPLVPLAKELKMTEEYISLEKIRYGNRFELHTELPEQTKDLYIAPLIILPFIENCFKHGISHMLEQPWLNMHISIRENEMTMNLLNSKPSGHPLNHKPGIGINNVRKRLELLYPSQHELIINDEEDIFIVRLKIQLERIQPVSSSSVISGEMALTN